MTREEKRAYDRLWYSRHRERRSAQMNAHYHKNRDRIRATDRKRRYGISPEEYDRLLKLQGGVCKLCFEEGKRPLSVDHCHSTGKVRGLLCATCNFALSKVEVAGWTERAKEYLSGN